MVIGAEGQDLQLEINILRATSNFNYLGIIRTPGGNSNQETQSKMVQVKTAKRQLNNLLRSTRITKHNTIRTYTNPCMGQNCEGT